MIACDRQQLKSAVSGVTWHAIDCKCSWQSSKLFCCSLFSVALKACLSELWLPERELLVNSGGQLAYLFLWRRSRVVLQATQLASQTPARDGQKVAIGLPPPEVPGYISQRVIGHATVVAGAEAVHESGSRGADRSNWQVSERGRGSEVAVVAAVASQESRAHVACGRVAAIVNTRDFAACAPLSSWRYRQTSERSAVQPALQHAALLASLPRRQGQRSATAYHHHHTYHLHYAYHLGPAPWWVSN